MRITVVTPCLNKVAFIEECLESVRSQGDTVVEHLIIDGESKDGTLEIIRGFDSNKIRLISEGDNSQSEALNKGIALAKGDVICWLNADDVLKPRACQIIADLAQDKDWDIAYGGMSITDEQGSEVALQSAVGVCYTLLLRMGCYVPSSGCFFRKAFLFDNDLSFREDLRYVMDWELFLRCAQTGARFIYTKQIVSAFRSYEGNMTSQVAERRVEKRSVQREFGMLCTENCVGIMNSWLQFYFYRFVFKFIIALKNGRLN